MAQRSSGSAIQQSYPETDRSLREMLEKISVRTVVDEWIVPSRDALTYQFLVDLTNVTMIRFSSQSVSQGIFVVVSEEGYASDELTPSDWTLMTALYDGVEGVVDSSQFYYDADDLRWGVMLEEFRKPLRIALSQVINPFMGEVPNIASINESFSVTLQVV
jgi:hypothetical protein